MESRSSNIVMEIIVKFYRLKEDKHMDMGYEPPDVWIFTKIQPWRHQDSDEENPQC